MVPNALENEFTTGGANFVPVFLVKLASSIDKIENRVVGLVLKQQCNLTLCRVGVFYSHSGFIANSTRYWKKKRDFRGWLDWLDSPPLKAITIV